MVSEVGGRRVADSRGGYSRQSAASTRSLPFLSALSGDGGNVKQSSAAQQPFVIRTILGKALIMEIPLVRQLVGVCGENSRLRSVSVCVVFPFSLFPYKTTSLVPQREQANSFQDSNSHHIQNLIS
jgi:hypothetical protein